MQVLADYRNQWKIIRYFCQILVYSAPARPRELYDHFLLDLLPPENGRESVDSREQRLLRFIARYLRAANRTLGDFELPEPRGPQLSDVQQAIEDLIPDPIDFTTGDPLEMTAAERLARAENVRVA